MFNMGRGATLPDIKLQGQPVALSESLKYIDITFKNNGTMFGSHLRDVSERAQRVMAVLGSADVKCWKPIVGEKASASVRGNLYTTLWCANVGVYFPGVSKTSAY